MLEAQPFGVAGVHLHQLAGEQGGLVAAGAGPDLDDHVLVVVRVAVYELGPDLLGQLLGPRFGGLRLGRVELALLVVFGLRDELPRVPFGGDGVEQLARHLGPPPHARVLLGDVPVAPLVRKDVRVGELLG